MLFAIISITSRACGCISTASAWSDQKLMTPPTLVFYQNRSSDLKKPAHTLPPNKRRFAWRPSPPMNASGPVPSLHPVCNFPDAQFSFFHYHQHAVAHSENLAACNEIIRKKGIDGRVICRAQPVQQTQIAGKRRQCFRLVRKRSRRRFCGVGLHLWVGGNYSGSKPVNLVLRLASQV